MESGLDGLVNKGKMMCNRVKNTDQTWVVYCHYDDDKVAYIGSGQVHRAFQFIKRSDTHYKWMVEQSLKNLTANFSQIVFVTSDYDEARYVESRLIAEHNPTFNKTDTKLTFEDIKTANKKIGEGMSLRGCAKELNISHNNLRIALSKTYSGKDYCVVI